MVVRTNSPFRTVNDLISRYRADPSSITWGAGSTGSTDHIFYALVSQAAGVDVRRLNYIPHENTGDIVAAVLGGHVQVGAGGYQDFAGQVEGGRMRVLAVGSPERLPGIDAPTLRESGLDVVLTNWRGVSAHPSITPAQLDRLSNLFETMAKSQSWKRILAARGWNDLYLDRHAYAAFIKSEQQRVRPILQQLGLVRA
jgi:putative tricarboxylic transport membrane protein